MIYYEPVILGMLINFRYKFGQFLLKIHMCFNVLRYIAATSVLFSGFSTE